VVHQPTLMRGVMHLVMLSSLALAGFVAGATPSGANEGPAGQTPIAIGNGGDVVIRAGDGAPGSKGGDVVLQAGDGSVGANGGDLAIRAGNGAPAPRPTPNTKPALENPRAFPRVAHDIFSTGFDAGVPEGSASFDLGPGQWMVSDGTNLDIVPPVIQGLRGPWGKRHPVHPRCRQALHRRGVPAASRRRTRASSCG
jgi:hypothetical protein